MSALVVVDGVVLGMELIAKVDPIVEVSTRAFNKGCVFELGVDSVGFDADEVVGRFAGHGIFLTLRQVAIPFCILQTVDGEEKIVNAGNVSHLVVHGDIPNALGILTHNMFLGKVGGGIRHIHLFASVAVPIPFWDSFKHMLHTLLMETLVTSVAKDDLVTFIGSLVAANIARSIV